MGRDLIVDGYNLARSGAVFLPEDPAGPEGRAELCAFLSGYARGKGFRLTVVFDARGAGTPGRTRQPFKGGTAVFSSRSESADDVIRDLCRGAPAGTVVVTSDRGLGGTLPSRGVTVVSCEDFAERLAACRREDGKGSVDEEGDGETRKGKKGEGHRKKKKERDRGRVLRKL
jgi:predicted RNA-binding protein with PIN domain